MAARVRFARFALEPTDGIILPVTWLSAGEAVASEGARGTTSASSIGAVSVTLLSQELLDSGLQGSRRRKVHSSKVG